MGKQKITMTINDDIFLEFKRLCKVNAMKVSSKVELMMAEYLLLLKQEELQKNKMRTSKK